MAGVPELSAGSGERLLAFFMSDTSFQDLIRYHFDHVCWFLVINRFFRELKAKR